MGQVASDGDMEAYLRISKGNYGCYGGIRVKVGYDRKEGREEN